MIRWTENQRKVIDFGKGTLLVSAGAGSGKTTVMLGRVMRLIEEGYSLKRMLISTFTVAAADDMRAKLSALLSAAYERTGDTRYLAELDLLPTADICTLHKWCQKLVRKYFFVTGDDPAFEIAETSECGVWMNAAIADAIEEAEADETSGFAELAELYFRKRSDREIVKIVRNVMSFASSQAEEEQWLDGAADCYTATDGPNAYLDGVAARKRQAIARAAEAFEALAVSSGLAEKALPLLAEVVARADGAEAPYTRATGITAIKPELDALKKRVADYGEFLNLRADVRNGEACRAAKTFLSLAKSAAKKYAALKAAAGKLDFTDLERKARVILSGEAGAEIRASLTHVFIDEYQDINPLQESIIHLVGNDNLFFVGDIKQSIYAFRDCTPEAFADKRDALSAGGNLVELNRNYRSRPGILRFCNLVFSRIMTADFGRVDYAGSAQFPVDEPPESGDDSVEIYSFPTVPAARRTEDFSDVYSVREHAAERQTSRSDVEAEYVTHRIVRLLRETAYTYDDIVVLVRSRTAGVGALASNLRAVGIPVSVSSKLKVTGGRCNGILLGWLKLIDNFADDISLAAVMRSPSVGFSDAELARIRAARPYETHFYDCVLACADDPKVAGFLATLETYVRLSRTATVGELAGAVTSGQKLFATALSERQGIAKADALGRLMESASAYGGTLSEYLEFIGETEPTVDSPPQPGSVRIMTVHASKGLEFPVVITFGLSGKFRTDKNAKVLADGAFGLGLESRVAETGKATPSLPLVAARLRRHRAQLEEEMRILYVELTRARDKLILFLPENTKEKSADESASFADWIYPSAVSHGIRPAAYYEGETAPPVRAVMTEDMRRQAERALAFDFAGATADIKKSVTGLLYDPPEEDTVAALADGGEYDGPEKADAMRRGTAYHAALERMDFSRPFAEQAETLAALPDSGLTDVGKLRRAHAVLGEEIAGSDVYREQPFIFASDASVNGESDGLILQGVIDLLSVRGREAEIIDYKTGFLTEERRKKYLRQLDLYAAATEKILGLTVTKKRVYLIEEGKFMD